MSFSDIETNIKIQKPGSNGVVYATLTAHFLS